MCGHEGCRDVALDALALVKARVDGDEEAAKYLLDEAADARAMASVLSAMMAVLLLNRFDDPEQVLAGFRAAYGAG